MQRARVSLATQILALQLGVILTAVAVGAMASVWLAREQLDQRYEQRALSIAVAVANQPTVRDALHGPDPSRTLQPLAESIRQASGASFVVIADRNLIRRSHPNPDLIGKPIDENPTVALSGKTWVGIESGTLGTSARGKAPIRDLDGTVIGIVSVGFLEEHVGAQLAEEMPHIATNLVIALILGVAGSLLLARRLKRQTFGLDPGEIIALLEHREASLHGIREGTLATDRDGRITLVNEEARRLIDLPADAAGKHLSEVVPPGRMRAVLSGEVSGADQVVVAADRILVASRMPVVVRGETIGAVVTLRDRTELEALVRELDGARGLTDALRAQAHEFSNRLHTIAGLIELGKHEEAIRLSTESSAASQELTESLLDRVGNPVLGALLLAKSAVAAERGIDFRLSDDTHLEDDIGRPRDLITIVGNLVDNAFDAVAAAGGKDRWVEVSVRSDGEAILVEVRDSGPGIDPGLEEQIFVEGFTTKGSRKGSRRGLGLALVRQVVQRHAGTIEVAGDGGSVFRVRLPLPVAEEAVR